MSTTCGPACPGCRGPSAHATFAGVTPPVIERWIEIIDTGRTDQLPDLLAQDAVFSSPAVFTPQEGRAKAAAYLVAAAKMFAGTGFRYVEKWYSDRSAVLEFVADIDGVHVNGVDIIHWNDAGEITSVKVMLRPIKALQAVISQMGKLLQQSDAADAGPTGQRRESI